MSCYEINHGEDDGESNFDEFKGKDCVFVAGCLHCLHCLFTWRESAPANWAIRLEGLKHSPPLHATHLTGTVSGLRELSFEQPLSTTNITAHQGNFFPSYFSFLHRHGPVLCLRLVYYIDLFRFTVILFGR